LIKNNSFLFLLEIKGSLRLDFEFAKSQKHKNITKKTDKNNNTQIK